MPHAPEWPYPCQPKSCVCTLPLYWATLIPAPHCSQVASVLAAWFPCDCSFRVICLLGMNDGDFPRRDPAAGLNRLTAELGTAQRRPGDRSRRDDDCLLFLQLFSAAQDVFYVSYLGADPHDGSLREPSPLLTELLSTAVTYHADPSTAAKTLLLRHSLQPFSPLPLRRRRPTPIQLPPLMACRRREY